MVKGELMLGARIGGVATKGCNGIHNVRMSSQYQIYKGAKGLLKVFSVHLRQRETDEMMIGE